MIRSATLNPAVFIDRDGTLTEHVDYVTDPAELRLLPGSARAVERLRAARFSVVVVTNQSAVARGLMSAADLERIHAELRRQLAAAGTAIDGIYHCTVAPASADRMVVEHFERKPGPGMLRRAAADLGLDLSRSWMVGDAVSDVLAGRNAGCRGSVRVRSGLPLRPEEQAVAAEFPSVENFAAAVEWILGRADPVEPRGGQ